MAESAKFSTQDITPDVLKRASPVRLKFNGEKMIIDAVVLADDLKDEMEGKDWKNLEREMEKLFDEQVKEMIAGIAKKVGSADEEIVKFPQELYDNFLRPINMQLEHTFEKHAERISSLLTSRLQKARQEILKEKKGASVKEPKVRIDFDLGVLVSSARRSVSSSGSGAPAVKPNEANKEISPAAQDCDTAVKKVEEADKAFRKAFPDAARVADPERKKHAVEEVRQVLNKYRTGVEELDKRLRELGKAITEMLDDQIQWKKRYSASKPTFSEEVQKTIKASIDSVIKNLESLSKVCEKTRDDVVSEGGEQAKSFQSALEALEAPDPRVAGPRLAAAVASMRSASPGFVRDVPKLVEESKTTATEIQRDLQKLSKAAASK